MAAQKGNRYAAGNSGGRKSLYKPEYAKQAFKLALLGATDREMAEFFQVTERTFNAWKKAHEELVHSLKKGKASADANVADRLYRRALGYEHKEEKIFNEAGVALRVPTKKHYPPDPVSAIFWLKNRQPEKWREKQFNDINISNLTEKQIDDIINKITQNLQD